MGGGRELGVVEIGEQLGDDSVHYSGFGLLGHMLRDQTNLPKEEQEEEEEGKEEVLDNQFQKRSKQPTVIETTLPGYKPKEEKRQSVNWVDAGLKNLTEEKNKLQMQGYERKSPIYTKISQQVKENVEDGGVEKRSEKVEIQVEPFADSLDMLPLEVEVEEVFRGIDLTQILIEHEIEQYHPFPSG